MSGDSDLLYGLHSVRRALQAGTVKEEMWIQASRHDDRLAELQALAEAAGVVVHRVERAELDRRVPGARHQGVVARSIAAQSPKESLLDELIQTHGNGLLLLVLDGIQDPHNLGACLRSADAAGVQALIVPRDRAAGMTPTVRKVACGAAESVPLIQVTNLARTLRRLRDAGVWLVGTAGEAEKTLYETDLCGPVAILLGGEERGLRRLTRELCDHLLRIPMAGVVESLNVSVAAGVCLFEARRQRERRGAGR